MKKILLVLLLAGAVFFSRAQRSPASQYAFAGGQFKISYYADSIVKITLLPSGYTQTEQLSDAVVLRGASSSAAIPLRIAGDSVFFNGRLLIAGTHHTQGFRGFRFPLQEGEMIFGAGERALPLNRRGS